MKSAKGGSNTKARLEAENTRLEDETSGMRRQLVEQAERIAQLERECAALREELDRERDR